MPKKNLRPKQEETAIDMTPMLDIVFIMLIFFIVTTAFVKESGVTVSKPEAENKKSQSSANIFIGITHEDDVYMLKKKIDKESIRTILANLLSENPESQVVIQADKASNSGVLLDVLDAAKLAGVKKVSVAAEK